MLQSDQRRIVRISAVDPGGAFLNHRRIYVQTVISVDMGDGASMIIRGHGLNPNPPLIDHVKEGSFGPSTIRLVKFRRIDRGEPNLPVSKIDTIAIRNIGDVANLAPTRVRSTGDRMRVAHKREHQPQCQREGEGKGPDMRIGPDTDQISKHDLHGSKFQNRFSFNIIVAFSCISRSNEMGRDAATSYKLK